MDPLVGPLVLWLHRSPLELRTCISRHVLDPPVHVFKLEADIPVVEPVSSATSSAALCPAPWTASMHRKSHREPIVRQRHRLPNL